MSLPVRRPLTNRQVKAVRGDRALDLPDELVTEEPLEVRVAWRGPSSPVAITMRTPGHDFELAVGFLLSEGIVGAASWVRSVVYCRPDGAEQDLNVVTVHLDRPIDLALRRAVPVSASCGVCGTATLDQLADRCGPLPEGPALPLRVLLGLPERLRREQPLFERSGGLHGAGIFDHRGEPVVVREDIGRHNAVDKIVGWAALDGGLPLRECVLVVSGRVSFEIVQKAAVAGIPVIVAVSAASSLAVETADRLGICLVGFARGDRANIYSHAERLDLTEPSAPLSVD